MVVYADDVIDIHHDPEEDMKIVSTFYRLNDGAGSSERCLGTNIEKVQLDNGREVWSMTCVDYLQGAVKNVNEMITEEGNALKMMVDGHIPYPSSYRPEIDVSEVLGP